jgi:arabinose-5-phosphate isomerase
VKSGSSSIGRPAEAAAGAGVLRAALAALTDLQGSWDAGQVADWAETMLAMKGRLVLTGMGKSGLIAQKIAATFASTGTPSFFLHPAEALHGDLGMVTAEDAVLALSNSGESEEVVRILPSLLRLDIPIAALTSKPESSLGKAARWTFPYQMPEGEGCPLDLAPMASTTLQLIWGDLLAATLMERRGFSKEGFALNHPAGSLGAKLLKVEVLMHTDWPKLAPGAPTIEVLDAITAGHLGMATVQLDGKLLGVISDGDIRRAFKTAEQQAQNPLHLTATEFMSRNPISTRPETLAVEAASKMEARKVTFLVVADAQGAPVGVLHIHDLLTHKVL